MQLSSLVLIAFVLIALSYFSGQRKAMRFVDAGTSLVSLPVYHGSWLTICTLLPAFLLLCLWSAVDGAIIKSMIISILPDPFASQNASEKELIFSEVCRLSESDYRSNNAELLQPVADQYLSLVSMSNRLKYTLAALLVVIGFLSAWVRLAPSRNVRVRVEKAILWLLIGCASIAIFTTIGIVFSVLFEAARFFDSVSIFEFVFGTHWSPQISIREGQVGSSGSFGAVPLFVGTLLITAIAMLVAVPLGLMSAIYLSEYASAKFRAFAKPILEILAGIPTVVYGFFAAITIAPMLRGLGESIGLSVASESALAAGLVMGVMIIPFVSSLSDDVISAVPQSLRDGSLGLGATKSETIKQVVIPAALPGIVGGILLAVSRAIGETMIVVMAAGLSAKLTINPLEAVTTVTVQIVTLLVGDQEFDSPKTLAAFALGLMLFITTLCLNVIALHVVRKYREQYD